MLPSSLILDHLKPYFKLDQLQRGVSLEAKGRGNQSKWDRIGDGKQM